MEETESDLYLDTSELPGKSGAQSESVTDRYEIDVFSNEFEETLQRIEEQSNTETEELSGQIFVSDIDSISANDITGQLFGETRDYLEADSMGEISNRTIGYGAILIAAIAVTLIIVRQQKRKKEENAGHYIKEQDGNRDEYQD